jgi:hypothetical protein
MTFLSIVFTLLAMGLGLASGVAEGALSAVPALLLE